MKTFEEIKDLFPSSTDGYFVDQNDSLNEIMSEIQECIHDGNHNALDVIFNDWYADYSYYESELKKAIVIKFDIDEDEAQEIMEEHEDMISETMNNLDTSTPIKDLFRNTGKQTMFYDTGYEVAPDSWNWSEKEIKTERQRIKKILGIRTKDQTLNEDFDMMIRQASYGGKLVIYFYDYPNDYIRNFDDVKYIQFNNAAIAIIDVHQGSGDNCYTNNFKIKLPFKASNIFICSTFKYSYTHAVCGMIPNWCEDTKVSFERKSFRRKINLQDSTYNNHLEKEKKYNETYKNGSCTTGDMDINRHRNKTYENNFPCGTRCNDCSTFWID